MAKARKTAKGVAKAKAAPNAVNAARKKKTEVVREEAPWVCTTFLPNIVVVGVAFAAVWWEYTTNPTFTHSSELSTFLKHCFIVFVCFAVRRQLLPLFLPPQKKQTLWRVVKSEIQGVVAAILANCAGTSVINPLCGSAPQYASTVNAVIPIYAGTAVLVGVLQLPIPALQLVIGFCVGWLKAMTIAKLVVQWQAEADAHPVSFFLIMTSNLFASGFAVQFMGHYLRTSRIFCVSMGLIWDVVRIMLIAGSMGLVAHTANHFMTQEERQMEAFTLYFLVAWYTFNKYWKAPLVYLFTLPFTRKEKQA
ncbi:TPA: hypothetical protein N0F65_005209 [Lagenidium giganteum]|uniref:Uncharacterized protein n=1 Tax=Lagenidium giganteum TaxID=4803 RepID=A0AAV2Z185_9STRA|nr:TPA: hypothetical protein N0F65_005209 [Lagenidium giganteum]